MQNTSLHRWQKYARWALLGFIMAVLVLTLMPNPGRGQDYNLRPGHDLDYSQGLLNLAANIVLFIPVGALARWAQIRRLNLLYLVLATIGLSGSIEFFQWYAQLGRQADINDVIANALGSAIGFVVMTGLMKLILYLHQMPTHSSPSKTTNDAASIK